MPLSTTSVESLTRTRIAVAVISAVAAISVGYYAYQARDPNIVLYLPPGDLHRSNGVRRPRRLRRQRAVSSSSSDTPEDDNAAAQPEPDEQNEQNEQQEESSVPLNGQQAETLVDEAVDDDWGDDPNNYTLPQRAGQNIVNLLFRLSEDNARRNGCVHRGCQCNACGIVPIRGIRYRCANCADFDLCETCEAQGVHIKTHIFYKIRIPAPPFGPRQMQPVWYTGDPDTCRRNLPRALMAKLSHETGFERPELEAFWEQWTYMANSEWREDPNELYVAMDRKTFERCLVPTGGSHHASPNLIHDRMFAFYDTNNDDLIGFTEFLHGISYRKRKDKLQAVFDGYDIDGDGFVDRRDFLRMFRAYYVLYKQMHKDTLDGLEDQLMASTEAQQLVASRQPLSSLFGREGRLPNAESNLRFEGKTYHADGNIEIAQDQQQTVTAENRQDTASRQDILTSLFACDSNSDNLLRRGYVTGSDADENWRTVRRLSGNDVDRTYWVTLLELPSSLEEIPDILITDGSPNNNIQQQQQQQQPDEEQLGNDADDEVEQSSGGNSNANANERRGSNASVESRMPTESEARAKKIEHDRREAPKLEKRRRDMARRQLHERWKRRQFYLDEEEGGSSPEDWDQDEDVISAINGIADDMQPATTDGGHANLDTPSGRIRQIAQVERDAGKEILYQVTQQAFNELLDAIFKPMEDFAIEAGLTKDRREMYQTAIDAIELTETEKDLTRGLMNENTSGQSRQTPIQEKSLEDLLNITGFSIAVDEPRHAVDLSDSPVTIHEDEPDEDDVPNNDDYHHDPTMPQFRPNSTPTPKRIPLQEVKNIPIAQEHILMAEPTAEVLRHWKRLELAEEAAKKRGGWGKLAYDEFEKIYRMNENQGNRLDYLGSWIDFCIPRAS